MSTELVKVESQELAVITDDKVQLLKDTICKGVTDSEMQFFIMVANRMGLDPFSRQIVPVKRWDSKEKREVMSIQTTIDGYRAIAERTGVYAGNDDYSYNGSGANLKASATVYKIVAGHRVPFTASARYSEFVQTTKNGGPNFIWSKMPYHMLGKCAEALAMRKAFPSQLQGIYTAEEMGTPVDTSGQIIEVEPEQQPEPIKITLNDALSVVSPGGSKLGEATLEQLKKLSVYSKATDEQVAGCWVILDDFEKIIREHTLLVDEAIPLGIDASYLSGSESYQEVAEQVVSLRKNVELAKEVVT